MQTSRRTGLLAACAVLPLAACGSSAPLAAGGAVAHYDGAAEAVFDVLSDGDDQWSLAEETRKVTASGGTCEYTAGTWTPEASLPSVDSTGWQERLDALNPVLAAHGFEEASGTTQDGSREVLETRDEHGATLQITEQGQVRIWGAEVDADPCDPAELGLG